MTQTVSFSKNATNLFFHILTRCNLKCRHCYINTEQHGKNTLSIADIEAWLALFAKNNTATNLVLLGGEPTLHPDLAEAVKIARRLGYESITIDSNGYLFHDILSRITPEDIDFLSFSLDGATQATNDAIRGVGSYDACTRGLATAKEKGFRTSLIYTVSSHNLHELEKMPEKLYQFGVQEFFIQVIGIRGNSATTDNTGLQVTRELWNTTIPKVAESVADLGISVTYPKVFLKRGEHFECAGQVADNYFVFPNGRVYRCPLCEDFPIHFAQIENNQLIEQPKLNEQDFFPLSIPEGCVMNKMIQPENLCYTPSGTPEYQIACCLLKERVDARKAKAM